VGTLLTAADEYVHDVGLAKNWNESRYVDFWDARQRVGGWLRIGVRPNEGYAEMSVCVHLPDARVAFTFQRSPISGNVLAGGGQEWDVVEPFALNRIRYCGEALLLEDPWLLTDPKRAYAVSPRTSCQLDLAAASQGLKAVMGADQDDVDRIFLPGQADFHYQHLARTTGRVQLGDDVWEVDGRGGKDHSWGPRNWHAKRYLRWLICSVDDDSGFMLVRAVGADKRTRSGHVWDGGEFYVVDDFAMRNTYADGPHHQLLSVEVLMRAAGRTWTASGRPQSWVPLRHRQSDGQGGEAILRIVKSPTEWTWDDGRSGAGHCEYHDLLEDGVPAGLAD
jgi:hypothetical protein